MRHVPIVLFCFENGWSMTGDRNMTGGRYMTGDRHMTGDRQMTGGRHMLSDCFTPRDSLIAFIVLRLD
jgi:hypothetical protein